MMNNPLGLNFRPEPPAPKHVDYVAWNKELKKRHAQIQAAWTRAENHEHLTGKKDLYRRVVDLCVEAKAYFDTIMWPDNWAWYNNMFRDAQQKAGVNWNEVRDLEDLR